MRENRKQEVKNKKEMGRCKVEVSDLVGKTPEIYIFNKNRKCSKY